jgi:glycosyltransferase 2 family protein
VLALFWTDRDSLAQVPARFGSADWRLGALALVTLCMVDVAKTLRWQVLYGEQRPTFRRVLQAQVLGQAANTLVPLRLGEVLRVSWAAPTRAGVARGTAGLVLSKAIDAVVLAALIATVFGGSLLAQAQLLPAVILGLLVAVALGLAQRYRHIGGGGLAAVRPLLGAATRYARELHLGILLTVLVTSAFAWVIGGVANLAVLAAVGAPPTIDFAARVLVSGYVAGLLPAPPGRLGVFEGAVAAALAAGGMDLSLAITVAVVLHALQLLEVGLLVVAATRWR